MLVRVNSSCVRVKELFKLFKPTIMQQASRFHFSCNGFKNRFTPFHVIFAMFHQFGFGFGRVSFVSTCGRITSHIFGVVVNVYMKCLPNGNKRICDKVFNVDANVCCCNRRKNNSGEDDCYTKNMNVCTS